MAERLNRTLIENARSMLIQSAVGLWAEEVDSANYLKNRSPTKAIAGKTPEEVWSKKRPDLKNLRTFGCRVLVHISDQKRTKWQPKAEEFIFVGYCEYSKGYRVVHPRTKTLKKARDVTFFENIFPSENTGQNIEFFDEYNVDLDVQQPVTIVETTVEVGDYENREPELVQEFENRQNELEPEIDILPIENNERRRRVPNRLIYNDDFVTLVTEGDPISSRNTLARKDSQLWRKAMAEEIESHKQNGTWEICCLLTGRKVISSKWVFKIKYTADGSVEKYKARLAAKGCSQKEGIDYEETFSPVVRINSIRLLLALAADKNLEIDQMDVVTALLYPSLEEEIYMCLPEDHDLNGKVVRLKK